MSLVVLVTLATCRSGAYPGVAPPVAGERTERFAVDPSPVSTACPMHVEGADVVFSFVDGGGAFVFTAATSRAIEIRRAARKLSALYDTELPPAELIGESAERAIQESPLGLATRVEYADLAGGARMEVTALRPSEVISLQHRLRQEAVRMDLTNECQLRPPAEVAGFN